MSDLNEEILKKALASIKFSPEKIKNIIALRNKINIISEIDNWTKNRSGKLSQDPALTPKNPEIISPTKNLPNKKSSLVQNPLNNNNVKFKNQKKNSGHNLNNNKNRLFPHHLQLTDIENTKPDQVSISAENPTKNSPTNTSIQSRALKKSYQVPKTHSNDPKSLELKSKASKIESNKNPSDLVLVLSSKKPCQVSIFHNNTKNPEDYTGKINNDTYLSLLLNIDYLSADISALYTVDSDSMNNLLNPIKESIKQLESANIEQKLKAIEK